MAQEVAGLVGILQRQARTLDAFVGDEFLGIRERQRFLVFFAEVVDAHCLVAGGRRRLGVVSNLRRRFGSRRFRLGRDSTKASRRDCQDRGQEHSKPRNAGGAKINRTQRLHVPRGFQPLRPFGLRASGTALLSQTCLRLAMRTAQIWQPPCQHV